MKQKEDKQTIDAFSNGLIASHYIPLLPPTSEVISGNRWMGSKTPDRIRDLWSTPLWLFRYLDQRYGPFNIDGAASANNAKCDRYFSLGGEDAFFAKVERGDRIFLNPPFSHMDPWIVLARRWADLGAKVTVVCPHDTSTSWAANGLINAGEIIHVIGAYDEGGKWRSGRISFVNADTGKEEGGNNKGTLLLHFDRKKTASKTLYISRPMMEKATV